jgi:small GTP-binding protein
MKIKKSDFFEVNTREEKELTEQKPNTEQVLKREKIVKPVRLPEIKKEKIRFIDNDLKALIEDTAGLCRQLKQTRLENEVDQVKKYIQSMRFTVTVVGEFSRGKSTLLNKLLGGDVVPVGVLPTTAMLTKITYNDTPMVVHINEKGHRTRLPLEPDSWEGLTADMNGNDAKGVIYTGIPSTWLLEHDLEFIDTPGAQDLQNKRMEYVDQAIMTSDCVIITISATQALSLTEKMFMEERILSRKLPRILLAVTKLDLIPKDQQETVMVFIQSKLKEWQLDVPVFVTAEDVEAKLDGMGYGIEAIKEQLIRWVKDDGHLKRKYISVYAALNDVLTILKQNLETKLSFYQLEEEKRKAAAAKEKALLRSSEFRWEDLQTQMMMRCNNNFDWMHQAIAEKQEAIIERIQYELAHTNNPKEWWEKDYPYRLKLEMVALGTALENGLQQLYAKDIAWLNNILENEYKTNILQEKETMADKELFKKWNSAPAEGLKDMKRERIISRIGTGVATVSGYLIFGSFGLAPLGSAVGIGGGLLSEVFINRNIEAQKKKLSENLRLLIPKAIDQAVEEVERKLRKVYEAAIGQARQKEAAWLASRYEAIDSALAASASEDAQPIKDLLDKVSDLQSRIKNME